MVAHNGQKCSFHIAKAKHAAILGDFVKMACGSKSSADVRENIRQCSSVGRAADL
jgi:hypothetical protein